MMPSGSWNSSRRARSGLSRSRSSAVSRPVGSVSVVTRRTLLPRRPLSELAQSLTGAHDEITEVVRGHVLSRCGREVDLSDLVADPDEAEPEEHRLVLRDLGLQVPGGQVHLRVSVHHRALGPDVGRELAVLTALQPLTDVLHEPGCGAW